MTADWGTMVVMLVKGWLGPMVMMLLDGRLGIMVVMLEDGLGGRLVAIVVILDEGRGVERVVGGFGVLLGRPRRRTGGFPA